MVVIFVNDSSRCSGTALLRRYKTEHCAAEEQAMVSGSALYARKHYTNGCGKTPMKWRASTPLQRY
jgi:hypothetical protein